MPKISLSGFITSVGDIQFVGSNNTAKQVILLNVPGWTNNFGEKIGTDDVWEIVILGKKVDEVNIHPRHEFSKVVIEAFLSSRPFTNAEGRTYHIVNVNLASIQFVDKPSYQPNNQNPVPSNTPPADLNSRPGDEEDLPF